MDHIRHAIDYTSSYHNHFDDMEIVHQSIAQLNWNDLQIAAHFGELHLSSPLFINAMTGGGGLETEKINRNLARAAAHTGINMAVGSQMAALKDPKERRSYQVVREENPRGIIFANVGSEASVAQVSEAIEMLNADAVQIHLNTLQELIMPEGDRDFTNRLSNIEAIVEAIEIPVVVKEVGFGIAKETGRILQNIGVDYFDVGGRGGTDFSNIENKRRKSPLRSFENWGVPTPVSIMELKEALPHANVMGSGGIRHGLDGVKTLLLGADAFGMSGTLLKVLHAEGVEGLIDTIVHIHEEIKIALMLMNASTLPELRHKPYVLTGATLDWREQRLNGK
ncbi:type 2 isopentenyl-diphosphate Delta-isomerase [Thalassobacillus sp. CUG 92003]|uniref:type 2 isopentenyl-diphosphate Delta-isomerase n=1 Tax=Thalassobacillus sp. CUG 92003 TaxID=2736641 RepID=UPI0021060DC9|nr:type 2 isopentenyl-diphosphate Delta-isomerase [Thalassobacillus sp. CUG 92003]